MTTLWTPTDLGRRYAELERVVSAPLDLEHERWRALRHRYVVSGGRVGRVRTIGGGSFTSGTQVETIYANRTAGTAKNTFTTEAQINDTAAMGAQAKVGANVLWRDPQDLTCTLRFTARGLISTTTGPPTFTWAVRFASTSGALIGGTAALTTIASVTNKLWEMEFDVMLVTKAAAGTNSTVRGMGLLSCPAGLAAPGVYEVWGGATQPGTVATVDVTADNLVFFDAACGTSSASNGITLLQLLAQGLN